MAVAGYNIYVGGVKKNTSLVTTLTYNITALTAGTSHNVEVRAVDDQGLESASDAAQIRNFLTKPGTVTGVTPTPASSTAISLTWGVTTGAASYKIERKLTSGSSWTSIATGITGTSYNDNTGLSAATSYDYRVKAVNATGESIAWSTTAAATTQSSAQLSPPTSFAASSDGISSINLYWDDVENENGYQIDVSTDSGATFQTLTSQIGPNVTTYTHTGLAPNNVRDYRIRTLGNGTSTLTSGWSATIQGKVEVSAPAVSSNDITNIASANHALGASKLEFRQTPETTWYFPNKPLHVGNKAWNAGQWEWRVFASDNGGVPGPAAGTSAFTYTSGNTAYDPDTQLLSLHADYGVTALDSTWAAKGLLGGTFTKVTGKADVTLAANAVNGLPAVQFTGTQGIQYEFPAYVVQPLWVHLVVYINSTTSIRQLFDSPGSTLNSASRKRITAYVASSKFMANASTDSATAADLGAATFGAFVLLSFHFTGTTVALAKNGGAYGTPVATGNNWMAGIRFGVAFNDTSNPFTGMVAAMEINNNPDREAAIISHLKTKYAL